MTTGTKLATRPHPNALRAGALLVNDDKIFGLMLTLKERWADEAGYEDIADYGRVLAKHLPKGVTLVRMSKRPFGPIVKLPNHEPAMQLYWKSKGRSGHCLALMTAGTLPPKTPRSGTCDSCGCRTKHVNRSCFLKGMKQPVRLCGECLFGALSSESTAAKRAEIKRACKATLAKEA